MPTLSLSHMNHLMSQLQANDTINRQTLKSSRNFELQKMKTQHGLTFQIQIDGGVTDNNAHSLIAAGATNLVAGSFVFSEPQKNYGARIAQLR